MYYTGARTNLPSASLCFLVWSLSLFVVIMTQSIVKEISYPFPGIYNDYTFKKKKKKKKEEKKKEKKQKSSLYRLTLPAWTSEVEDQRLSIVCFESLIYFRRVYRELLLWKSLWISRKRVIVAVDILKFSVYGFSGIIFHTACSSQISHLN